ncbi:10 kDa chaperonin [Glycine soja]|uniref:10 kDa chaperonin n=1 Tax=Glycine soja TaxID=3848 RepID=A0A0B2QXN5_GLYSO|nr:10 kDa chaperonin [Glycine soja]
MPVLNFGKVIAVGPGFHSKNGKLIPKGDTVLLPEYGGTEVKLDNKEWLPYPLVDLILEGLLELLENKECAHWKAKYVSGWI